MRIREREREREKNRERKKEKGMMCLILEVTHFLIFSSFPRVVHLLFFLTHYISFFFP